MRFLALVSTGEGQEIDWIGHTEYSETRIEQLDHIYGGTRRVRWQPRAHWKFALYRLYPNGWRPAVRRQHQFSVSPTGPMGRCQAIVTFRNKVSVRHAGATQTALATSAARALRRPGNQQQPLTRLYVSRTLLVAEADANLTHCWLMTLPCSSPAPGRLGIF